MTLVRRDTGAVRFLVCETLQDVDEAIAAVGDETVILCTDQYTVYDGIDDHDGIDAHLAVNHSEHFVAGDAHVNHCENRHSFLRDWLGTFRGVSKHHLQGYLDFLSLLLNADQWFDRILGTECYTRALCNLAVYVPEMNRRWQLLAVVLFGLGSGAAIETASQGSMDGWSAIFAIIIAGSLLASLGVVAHLFAK